MKGLPQGVLGDALLYALMLAGFTTLGSSTALIGARLPSWGLDFGLGFAAGIMVVTSFASLLLPAIEKGMALEAGLGVALGALLVLALDALLPHEHAVVGYEGPRILRGRARMPLLVMLAMTIHNVPEGLAVGVSVAYDPALALAMVLSIGIQDIPEGVAAALPLTLALGSRAKGVIAGTISGMVEALAAVVGALIFCYVAPQALGLGLGLAAGAMIYIVMEEIAPEVLHQRAANRRAATAGLFLGLYTALYIEAAL